jgi:hypothetical protein
VANEVEAHGARGDLQFNLSDRASVSARGGFGNAKAGYDVLAGDDGQRIGLGGHGGATASVFQGELSGSANGTIGEGISTAFGPLGALLVQGASSLSPKARDLLNTPVEIEATVSGSAISAGADGEAVAYYDRETGQTTAAIGGEIAALLGLGCDLRITIGEDKSKSGSQSDSPGATGSAGPNVIVGGSGTVLVGG